MAKNMITSVPSTISLFLCIIFRLDHVLLWKDAMIFERGSQSSNQHDTSSQLSFEGRLHYEFGLFLLTMAGFFLIYYCLIFAVICCLNVN